MASLFWVGGAGTFDGTTNHFATTTGGTATVAAPVSGDVVAFDANSGSGTISFTADMTCGTFTCSTAGITIAPGTQTVTVTAISGTIFQMSAGSWTAGTSTLTFSGNGTTTQAMGTLTYGNVTLSGNGTKTFSGAFTCNNFTFTGPSGQSCGLILSAGPTINGAFTVTGTYSGTNAGRIVVSPSILTNTGNGRTVTVNGSVSLTNADFNYITAGGSATQPWTGTSIGDGGGNTGITFDSPRTLYWVGVATNWNTLARWSLSSGGAAATTAPLPQDDCNIDSNSGVTASGTFSNALRFMGRNIDFTGMPNAATCTFALGGFNPGVTGNLTWAAGMTLSSSSAATFNFVFDTRSVTLTNNGCTYGTNWSSRAGGTGSFTLGDDLSMAQTFTFDGGTFNANNKNCTLGGFSSTNTNLRTLNLGSGTYTLTGTGVVFNCATVTNLTFSGASAAIYVTDTSASSKTIEHRQASNKIGAIYFTGGGAGAVIFGPSGYYGTLSLGAPKTYTFSTSGTGTKVDEFLAMGDPSNTITINSSSAGTQAKLLDAAGTVACDYLSLQDSLATGGAKWYAGRNSTNVSNNAGWIFDTYVYFVQASSVMVIR